MGFHLQWVAKMLAEGSAEDDPLVGAVLDTSVDITSTVVVLAVGALVVVVDAQGHVAAEEEWNHVPAHRHQPSAFAGV